MQIANDLNFGVLGIRDDARCHARAGGHHGAIVKTSSERWQIFGACHVDHVMNGGDGGAWPHQRQKKMRRMQQIDFVPAENSRQLKLFAKRIVLQAGAKFFVRSAHEPGARLPAAR